MAIMENGKRLDNEEIKDISGGSAIDRPPAFHEGDRVLFIDVGREYVGTIYQVCKDYFCRCWTYGISGDDFCINPVFESCIKGYA